MYSTNRTVPNERGTPAAYPTPPLGLVDHDPGVGHGRALALGARGQQERPLGGAHPEANRGHLRLDLHSPPRVATSGQPLSAAVQHGPTASQPLSTAVNMVQRQPTSFNSRRVLTTPVNLLEQQSPSFKRNRHAISKMQQQPPATSGSKKTAGGRG